MGRAQTYLRDQDCSDEKWSAQGAEDEGPGVVLEHPEAGAPAVCLLVEVYEAGT
jgi:hypothetical protein